MPLRSLVRTTMRQDQTCLTARESVSPSDDDLAKRGAPSTTSSNAQCFAKGAGKVFLLKVETPNLFHHLRQNYSIEHS